MKQNDPTRSVNNSHITKNGIIALIRVIAVSCCVYLLDRLTKMAAARSLDHDNSVPIIPNILHLTLTSNTGAAFGLLKDQRIFFLLLSLCIILFILIYTIRHASISPGNSIAFGLILGGAIGNMVDRLRFGYVIDFIDLRIWPVFNIADSSICIGAGILLITAFLSKEGIS